MSKMKIGTTLYITFMSMIIYILLLATGNYFVIRTEADISETLYNNYGKVQGDVSLGFAYFQKVKVDLRNVLYLYANDSAGQADAIEALETSRKSMDDAFGEAEKAFLDDNIKDKYNEAVENINLYLADVDQCLEYVSAGQIVQARQHLRNNGIDSANKAAGLITSLVDDIHEKAENMLVEERKSQNISNTAVGLFLLFILLSVLFSARLLIKSLRDPMADMAEIAAKVALGDVSQDISRIDNDKNEIAILNNSFCSMMDNLKLQAAALDKLADGNLDIDYTPVSDEDIVGKAIGKLIKDNNSAFGKIRNASKQISIGSGQIASASQTLAQGNTEQASAIQQISSSVTDITSKTKDNVVQANEVNDIVKKTKDNINIGNGHMGEMVAAMNDINDSAAKIHDIIKVIDNISFNTNIIALNASVEAARAGEYGKGFAVVAEEIRNLAGRSAEASSQTAELIEDSIIKVKRGSELAHETAGSLDTISGLVDNVMALSAAIVKSSNEQASATAQIDQALTQVSQVVQTNSATSQQCASASEELSGQARGLDDEISKFRLKDINSVQALYTSGYDEPLMLGNADTGY